MVEVNSLGKFQRSLGVKPSRQGEDIELTIDINLQLVAEEVLKDKKGGAIIDMAVSYTHLTQPTKAKV